MSRGQSETERLVRHLEEQMNRLMMQMDDLETFRDELDLEEYNETKEDTQQQLTEFSETLERAIGGNMTLVDKLGSMQLAIRAAIANTFKTPEIIQLFASRRPAELRERLDLLEQEYRLRRIEKDPYMFRRAEILTALKKLDETLSDEEEAFLAAHASASLAAFEKAENTVTSDTIVSAVSSQIRTAR